MASSAHKLAYDRAWRTRNRERVRDGQRAWRKANAAYVKQRFKDDHLQRAYGLSSEAWAALFDSQGKRCAACRCILPGHKNGWQVDHDHVTGNIRGILCCSCNIALHVIEKPLLVKQLQAYLEAHHGR